MGHQTLLLIFSFLLVLTTTNGAPDYDFNFESLETLDGSESYFEYNYTLTKESELCFKSSGNVRQLVQLGDEYTVLFKLSRSELKAEPPVYEQMMESRKSFCKFFNSIYRMYFYEGLKDVSNFPHYETCPLAPADYWFKDYSIEGDQYKAFMKEGRFKVEFYLGKDDAPVAGIALVITVAPIESER
ncbi:uncharacterized protein LOC129763099 [Toxorhynchites rutilus septentrionalis]|uniref:uncharacterized protein LOC129763099 n=1 Tax=Toxorhynchites rutilus septentrionalis TaxID=329112 RepID=UPI002478D31F|nr:uncharacterized protein LOC129763099 [Toxorhynchites rutilus septentrionalis]